MAEYRILGAGLSGLSAAINLAKAGEKAAVYELRAGVGMHIAPNYQALRSGRSGSDITGYLASLNLAPEGFDSQCLGKMWLDSPAAGMRELVYEVPVPFMLRGGNRSLEQGLYRQALGLGVRFEFNYRGGKDGMHIIASGRTKCDCVAYGEVFEAPEFSRDHFFYMHNDKYSPKGWYAYMIPMGPDKLEIVNCVPQPYVARAKEYFDLLLREHPFVRKFTEGRKPLHSVGGYGGVDYPVSAFRGGQYLVGEAGGFQDACRGFGMHYAMESGHLAAKAILEKKDYDKLWKAAFDANLRTDFAMRFALSVVGHRGVDWYLGGLKDGDVMGGSRDGMKGPLMGAAEALCFHAAIAKMKITGKSQ